MLTFLKRLLGIRPAHGPRGQRPPKAPPPLTGGYQPFGTTGPVQPPPRKP